MNKSNETIQEWLNKLMDTENQLKQKKQELKHAQDTIQQLEVWLKYSSVQSIQEH